MARTPNLIERIGLALAGGYVREAAGDIIDADDVFYRRITDARRDLNPVSIERAQEISLHLWRSNPMAKRLVEMMVDFTVGADGLSIEAEEDAVQEVIDEFWTDPRTNWDLRNRDIVRDLSIYGELALRKFSNEQSGRMRVGVIDCARIDDVLPDPDDMLVDKVLMLRDRTSGAAPKPVELMVYDDLTDPTRPHWTGEAFYFAVNRVIGQHRGMPDLFAIADYVDGYDQLLFNALERTGLINAFIYDVTLEGADDAAIEKWQRKYPSAPPPGSVRVHNEKEKWLTPSPQLGSQDVVAIGRAVKNMGLGGAGLPEAWFAEGDSANRATLDAQGDPTYRMLQSRQKYVRSMFERMIHVLLQENVGKRLPKTIDTTFRINMPELSSTDTTAITGAMTPVVTSLTTAIAEELIDRKNARTLFLTIASQLGVDLDPQEVEDAIEEQRDDEEARAAAAIDAARRAMVGGAVDDDSGEPVDQGKPSASDKAAAVEKTPKRVIRPKDEKPKSRS